MASLLNWLGNGAKRVANTVNNDVVKPVQRDVVAPVAHAAGNVVNAAQATPRVVGREATQLPGQVLHGVVQPTVHQFGVALPKSVYDIGRGAAASLTHNQLALQHANQAKMKDESQFLSPFTRPLAQAAETIVHPLSAHTVTPRTQTEKTLLGSTPIQNVQAGVKTNFQQHSNLRLPQRIALAGAYGAGQVAQDAAAVMGAKGALAKGINEGAKGASAAIDVAQRKPFRQVTDHQLGSLKRVALQRQGFGDAVANVKPHDVATYRQVQRQLGTSVNDHDMIDNVIAARQQWENRQAMINQKLQALPIGLGTRRVDTSVAAAPVAEPPTKVAPAAKAPTGTIVPPTSAAESVALPNVTKNSLTRKVARQNLSPEAQKLVQGEGPVRNTQQLQDLAVKNANKQGLNKTIQTAHEALAVEPGKINDATVAHVQQAIERADAAGRTEDAVALHDSLSEHLRKQGQTIQAASLLYRLSPQGLLYKGLRDLKKAGTTVTPELENKLRTQTETIKQATDPAAKQRATAEFHKLVADNIPQSKAQGILSVWKAGLLSGPLTQAGNFASNATFAALHGASNPLAAGIDKLISLKTGERTKTLTNAGTAQGFKQGVSTGIDTMKTGIDVRNIEGGKYEIHGELNFKNPVIQKVFGQPSNLVFRGMSAADQPFYYAALKNNLADVAKADGLTKGLKGDALRQHVAQVMNNPTTKQAETAKLAAQKAVLGQDSPFASALSKFANSHPALQAVIPFVKVPTNFLTRTLDFTPVGAVKTAVQQIRSGKLDQRGLSEALAEATTGTTLIGLGAELANNQLLSGQYPNDPKEQQRWKAEGIQPNSVKVGNKWISLNYLGPTGLLLGAGKDYHDAVAQGNNGAASALAGFGKSLTGQSFLTGFSGAANAINDPGRYGKNFINSQAASIVPAWVSSIANATDAQQRQADTVPQSIQARIPGARTNLPVKQDVYGNPLPQRTSPVDLTLNPLKPSVDLSHKNAVVAEVDRLHAANPNDSNLEATPTPLGKSISVEGKNVKLSDQQRYSLQHAIGQETQAKWGDLIKTPEYQAMTDTQKLAALGNIKSLASEDATRAFVVSNSLGVYNKAESPKAVALNQQSESVANLASSKATGGVSTGSTASYYKAPDAEYKALQAKYQTQAKQGFNSAAQKITMDKELAKAKVGAAYDKSIRDAYNLSSKDLYDYVHNDPNGKAIAQQVLDYSQALKDAGITSTAKFKNKYGQATIGNSKTSTGGRSRGGRRSVKIKTTIPKQIKFKTAKLTTKAPKAPSFKTKRASIPKTALQTPKVTVKKKAIA